MIQHIHYILQPCLINKGVKSFDLTISGNSTYINSTFTTTINPTPIPPKIYKVIYHIPPNNNSIYIPNNFSCPHGYVWLPENSTYYYHNTNNIYSVPPNA